MKLGISGRELARRAGVSESLVSALEAGRSPDPRVSTALALARVLNLTLDQLVSPKRRAA